MSSVQGNDLDTKPLVLHLRQGTERKQMSEEPVHAEQFSEVVGGMFASDQPQMIALHEFFSNAVDSGFTEDQALSLTAKLIREMSFTDGEEE